MIGLAAGTLSACASLPGAASLRLSVRVHDPVIIWSDTNIVQKWGVGTHPFLARISTSRVAVTYWISGDGGTFGVAPLGWPAYTDDGGQTWRNGDPYRWDSMDRPTNVCWEFKKGESYRYDVGMYFSGAQIGNGTRAYRQHVADRRDRSVRGLYVSSAGSVTGLFSLIFEPPDPSNSVEDIVGEQSSVTLADGRILTVVYGNSTGGNRRCRTLMYEWVPGNATSRFVSLVAGPENVPTAAEGPCEPALVQLGDGTLFCVMRTYGGQFSILGHASSMRMLGARSTDEGRTWKLSLMSQNGVCPKLLRMSNGVLAMAFGRKGNHITFSLDGGQTWGGTVALSPMREGTSGYVDIVEVAPGRLLVVYDSIEYRSSGIWLWDPPTPCNARLARWIDVKQRFRTIQLPREETVSQSGTPQ